MWSRDQATKLDAMRLATLECKEVLCQECKLHTGSLGRKPAWACIWSVCAREGLHWHLEA